MKTDAGSGHRGGPDVLVRFGVLLLETGEDRVELGLRLLDGLAFGEPALQEEPALPAPGDPGVPDGGVGDTLDAGEAESLDHHRGDPELGLEARQQAGEARRGDAHDRVRDVTQLDGLLEDVGAAAEAALPEPVTQHHHRVRALRLVLFGEKAASQLRLDSEQVEVVGRRHLAHDEGRATLARQDPAHHGVGGHVAEGLGAGEDVLVVGVRARQVGKIL